MWWSWLCLSTGTWSWGSGGWAARCPCGSCWAGDGSEQRNTLICLNAFHTVNIKLLHVTKKNKKNLPYKLIEHMGVKEPCKLFAVIEKSISKNKQKPAVKVVHYCEKPTL